MIVGQTDHGNRTRYETCAQLMVKYANATTFGYFPRSEKIVATHLIHGVSNYHISMKKLSALETTNHLDQLIYTRYYARDLAHGKTRRARCNAPKHRRY